jgi:plastocyanin
MNIKFIILAVVVVAGGLLLLGNLNNNTQPAADEAMEKTDSDAAMSEGEESVDAMEEGVKEFVIENEGLTFATDEIEANVGDVVRVTFKSTAGKHDWVIDEFDTRTQVINEGEEETIEFVVDQAGSFEFYCSVPGHREAGMVGTLTVE